MHIHLCYHSKLLPMTEEKNKKLEEYENMEKSILDEIQNKSNFGGDCRCVNSDFFLYVDCNLNIIPYCMTCGGISKDDDDEDDEYEEETYETYEDERDLEDNLEDDEVVGMPQIRERKRQQEIEEKERKEKEEREENEKERLKRMIYVCKQCGEATSNKTICHTCRWENLRKRKEERLNMWGKAWKEYGDDVNSKIKNNQDDSNTNI